MRKVYQSANLIDAHLVSARLTAAGVDNLVRGDLLTGAMGELPVDATPTIWVSDEAEAMRALQLIRDWDRDDRQGRPDWRCPRCGEVQSASFERCWHCGTEPS